MKKGLYRVILLSCLPVFLLFLPAKAADSSVLRKGPYLMLAARNCTDDICDADQTRMTVLWQTKVARSDCSVAWVTRNSCDASTVYTKSSGPVPEEQPWPVRSKQPGDWEHRFSYTIDNLAPGARTCYRVTCGAGDFYGSFQTPPVDGATTLSFYAYGDTRGGTKDVENSRKEEVHERLVYDMKSSPAARQTFCLHTGDFVMDGQDEKAWDRNYDNEYFVRNPRNMAFLTQLPVAGVLGNHEGYLGYNRATKKTIIDYVDFGQVFKKYFPYPFYRSGKDRFYYAFDYGPARFIVVDVNDRVGDSGNTGRNYTEAGLVAGSPQYDWLKRVLAMPTTKWKIVSLHNPLYSGSGMRERFQNDAGLAVRNGLHVLFRDTGVKLVLQGHNHYYSRSEVEGVTYLVLGGGGAPIRGLQFLPGSSGHPELKAARQDNCGPEGKSACYHYARIDITSTSAATVTVRDAWGDRSPGYLIETVPLTK